MNIVLRILLVGLLLCTADCFAQSASSFDIGLDYLNSKKFKQADSVFSVILRNEKDKDLRAIAFKYRGLSRIALKQNPKALDDFNNAIKLDSIDVTSILERAKIYISNNQFNVAILDLNKVVALDVDGADARNAMILLGELMLNEGEFSEVLELYDKLIEFEPKNGRYYYMKGLAIVKYLEAEESAPNKTFNKKNACSLFKKASSLGNTYAKEWLQGYCK